MNAATFLKECDRRGISISLDGGALSVKPENIPARTVNFIRQNKKEIISELSTHDASKLAVLLSLPDGFQFWLAPDGMEFDTGGIPVLRRSVMDEMEGSPDEIKKQLHTMVTALRELGGELSVSPETEGVTIYPDAQKARSGSLAAPI